MGGGGYALPGTYKLRLTYNDFTDSTLLEVKADPRLGVNVDVITKNQEIVDKLMVKIELLAKAYDRIKESKETMAAIKKITPKDKDENIEQLKQVTKEVEEAMKEMSADLFPKENVQGIYRNPNLVTTKLRSVRSALYSIEPLNNTELLILKQTEKIVDETLEKVNKFYEEDWIKYRKAVEEANISPFKDYKPLK